jgi:hypothetical protein
MANNGSRFHIEINSIKVDDMAVRFNIFGDTLAQVTADFEQVIAYVTASAAIAPQKSQAITAKPSAPAGVCCACGSDSLEWVTGTRKDNGKSFAAFKCQTCAKWQPEAKS